MTDTNTAAETNEASNLPNTLNDVSEAYFAASELASAVPLLEHLETLCRPVYNGDFSEGIPEGYGILVLPTGTEKTLADGTVKRQTTGVIVAAVPSLALVQASPTGADFIHSAILAEFKKKLKNATKTGNLPFTVEAFTTKAASKQADAGLQAYNELAKAMCAELKNRGLTIDPRNLRQCLQSAMEAERKFPKVAQGVWQKVLGALIASAKAKNLSPSTMEHWQATRDTVGTTDVSLDDIDL